MAKLVTIFGGSGFLGRYVTRQMANNGWRVRVAVRRPNEAVQVKTYGSVGQVEPVFCNIRDETSVRSVIAGANAVVNCVGILTEQGKNNFDAVHNAGASRVARIAADEKVGQLVHISAIGANVDAECSYSQSKGQGENSVLEQFPTATILRPSVIFGTEDQFFNKFAKMAGMSPILPIVGGDTNFQPVHVNDVAAAVSACLSGKALPGIYELGGPDVMSLKMCLSKMQNAIGKRRLVVNLPFWVGGIVGGTLDAAQAITLGLIHNTLLTRDQVKGLRHDNVVQKNAKGFSVLNLVPTAMDSVLSDYLWIYRPSGQFAAVKASAKNLKA